MNGRGRRVFSFLVIPYMDGVCVKSVWVFLLSGYSPILIHYLEVGKHEQIFKRWKTKRMRLALDRPRLSCFRKPWTNRRWRWRWRSDIIIPLCSCEVTGHDISECVLNWLLCQIGQDDACANRMQRHFDAARDFFSGVKRARPTSFRFIESNFLLEFPASLWVRL